MEKLIFLVVIIIISALHSWWKHRQGEPDGDDEQPPARPPRPGPRPGRPQPGPRPAAPPKAANWEEELRRLLEGETPAARPAAPAPPVIVAAPAHRAAPPPLPPVIARAVTPMADEGREAHAAAGVKMPSLEESAQAFLRGRTVDARGSERFQHVDQLVTTPAQAPASAAIAQSRALLRDRESLRAAIIASVVLGPPKALEQTA